jgi:hypothetical protein
MAKFVKWDRPEGQGARKQMDVGSTPCCSATAGADLYACSNVSETMLGIVFAMQFVGSTPNRRPAGHCLH